MFTYPPKSTRVFTRAMLAALLGVNDNDLTAMLKGIHCSWCAEGWPEHDGKHDVLGVIVPCDACLQPKPKQARKTWAERNQTLFSGRGIVRRGKHDGEELPF